MSYVTNVLLHIGTLEDEEARMAEVNRFLEARHGGLVSLQSSGDWYGGTKGFEASLWVGAFNYLDREGFLRHLLTVAWEYPDEVQVIWCGQDDDVFSIVTLNDAPAWRAP